MKIIVFGATGTVGAEIVRQSLEKGFEVTAFVRNVGKLSGYNHVNLNVHPGDVLNPQEVEKALSGHEAVFCALGDGRVGKIRASGTLNIIHAMHTTGIKRMLCLSTIGMGESYGNLNFFWKHIMFGMLLKKAFNDHKLQERYIRDSNLDYTIIRPSALTNGPSSNTYKVGFDGKYRSLTLKISRTDVADFMLRQLNGSKYSKKAVSISN